MEGAHRDIVDEAVIDADYRDDAARSAGHDRGVRGVRESPRGCGVASMPGAPRQRGRVAARAASSVGWV